MKRFLIGVVAALMVVAAPALAAPKFPPLTGRVVDNANMLTPAIEADLTGKLAALEAKTGRQLVVATIPDLQGYEIEEFGYQLGRAWGIGSKDDDSGALFIVAPNERKVRVEVGYGLEPVLTDSLSSLILQTQVIPKFKSGDMADGVVAGTDALIEQLSAPDGEARAQAAKAIERPQSSGHRAAGLPVILIVIVLIFLFTRGGGGGGGRRGRSGLASALPWIILGSLGNRGGGGWSGGGGFGGGGGGGGFSGGGGSFGGGGSSGSW